MDESVESVDGKRTEKGVSQSPPPVSRGPRSTLPALHPPVWWPKRGLEIGRAIWYKGRQLNWYQEERLYKSYSHKSYRHKSDSTSVSKRARVGETLRARALFC